MMAKRMTDSEKWRDDWFFNLSPEHKLLWLYICDNCDHAGVWKVSPALATALTGCRFNPQEAETAFGNRVMVVSPEYWWLTKFCAFQYGPLHKTNKTHASVIKILERHKLLPFVNQDECQSKEAQFRYSIIARDGNVCAYCDRKFEPHELNVDHVVAVSKGGSMSPDNLVACCVPCNSKKRELSLLEFCEKHDLDFESVNLRVSQRISRNLEAPTIGAKDKDKDKDKVSPKREGKDLSPLIKELETKTSFEAFWALYPRPTGKAVAGRSWAKMTAEQHRTAIEAVRWQVHSEEHLKREQKYIPHASTWLNQERYNDPRTGSSFVPKGPSPISKVRL